MPSGSLALAIERYQLGNGLTVMLWPHGNSPVAHGRLVIGSGMAHDPLGKEGVSRLVGAGALEQDSMVFAARELATNVDNVVAALAAKLRSPGYELSDEDKQFLHGRLVMDRAKERTSYARDLGAALYGERHRYARGSMTEDSLDHIDRDLVMKWARGHIVAKNAVMIIAGKFDPALVKKHVAYNADHVTAGNHSRDPDAVMPPRRQFVRGVSAKPSPTVEIAVHFVAGRGLDEHHARRLVLEQVLANRLEELRGKCAITYGVAADYTPRRSGGLWTISGEVDASRAAEAGKAIVAILDEVRRDPESYRAAFVLARQKVLERLLLTSTDTNVVIARLVEMARFDAPADFYDRVARDVAALTLSRMHELVVRELAAGGQVFGAFGNAPAVDAAIAAAQ